MKKVSMSKNFNGKMACSAIVHITQAPPQPVPECKLGGLYLLSVDDGSHPPVEVKLLYFIRFNLGAAQDIFTLPSHAMDAADFIKWYKASYPDADYGTELAAYYYQKNQ